MLFGPRSMGAVWEKFLTDWIDFLKLDAKDPDAGVVARLHDALKGGEFAVGGLTLGKNPSLNVIASFAKDEKAQKFLAELRGGDGIATLNGLPKVDPLILYAATGDGERNADMTRAL